MLITFVSGPTCAGKSYYIKENFKDAYVIDLFEFQKKYPVMCVATVLKSYKDCLDAILDAVRQNKDVVVEHTLLKAQRRKEYIDAIRKVSDCDIDMVFVIPDRKTMGEHLKQRNLPETTADTSYDVLEIPTKEEGFHDIKIVKPQ